MRFEARGAVTRPTVMSSCLVAIALAVAACSSSPAASPAGGGSKAGTPAGGGTAPTSAASAPAGSQLLISGAGEEAAAPVLREWASQYAGVDHRVRISYQPSGLGAGFSDFGRGAVTFGASDALLPPSRLGAASAAGRGPVLQLPMALGAVAVVYNVPGVTHLVLSGPVLADIYLGLIVKWNDQAIARLNPGQRIPSTTIQVFQRSDPASASDAFTKYLISTSASWASQVGGGLAPAWPIGTSAVGSSGLAAAVQHTAGAIGYVELGYARAMKITYASLLTGGGQAVAPSAASIGAAARAWRDVSSPAVVAFSLAGLARPGAYPISTPAYLVVTQRQPTAAKARTLRAWLEWALTAGPQAGLARLGYAPLPPALASRVLAAVRTLR